MAAPETFVPRVYVYDGAFTLLGQLTTASNVARSFALMQPTTASFDVKADDERILLADPRQGGRIVVIQSTAYPFPWVGYITRPNWQNGTGSVHVECKSLDSIFVDRQLPADFAINGTAGACIAAVVDQTNSINPTGVGRAFQVTAGPPRRVTASDRTAFNLLTSIARRAGYEWWVDYSIAGNQLTATVNFDLARGIDLCDAYGLQWPATCQWTDAALDMSQSYFAVTIVGGQASALASYTERERARAVATSFTKQSSDVLASPANVRGHLIEHTTLDTNPITRRERLDVVEQLKEQGDLIDAAAITLMRPPHAERSLRVAALDDGSSVPFQNLGVGNAIGLRIPDPNLYFGQGFNGCVRIVGVQPREAEGFCDLVVQVLGPHVDRLTEAA